MPNVYQSTPAADPQPEASSDGRWYLAAGTARSLDAAAHERHLDVEAGCVWVTFTRSGVSEGTGSARSPSPYRAALCAVDTGPDLPPRDTDRWLTAGQGLRVPAGTAAVLEAWPQAVFSVREVPPRVATRTQPGAATVLARVRRVAAFLGAGVRARNAASMAS